MDLRWKETDKDRRPRVWETGDVFNDLSGLANDSNEWAKLVWAE